MVPKEDDSVLRDITNELQNRPEAAKPKSKLSKYLLKPKKR